MARIDVDVWLPEDDDSNVIQRINRQSAVERVANRVPLTTQTKRHPRSGGVDVNAMGKGEAYTEDAGEHDSVLLDVRKLGRVVRVAEEDLDDNIVDVLASKRLDWATSYAKFVDNATLAVTAAANGTTVPYTSVYRELSQANTDLDYAAGDNIIQTGVGDSGAVVPPTYDEFSDLLGRVEQGDYFDPGTMVIIANPAFRAYLRGVKDDEGRPIFVQGTAGTPDTVFGVEVVWSLGARTSSVATASPDGHPIAVYANRDLLLLGTRSGPESIFIDPRDGLAALTDEGLLKMRARRAFALGHPKGVAILEVRKASA